MPAPLVDFPFSLNVSLPGSWPSSARLFGRGYAPLLIVLDGLNVFKQNVARPIGKLAEPLRCAGNNAEDFAFCDRINNLGRDRCSFPDVQQRHRYRIGLRFLADCVSLTNASTSMKPPSASHLYMPSEPSTQTIFVPTGYFFPAPSEKSPVVVKAFITL